VSNGGGQEPAASQPASSGFAQGIEYLRSTAKWLIVVFAAVGAVLAAGTQLSSIGKLQWGDGRLTAAIVAAAVALVAIGAVIATVLAMLMSGYMTLAELAKKGDRDREIKFLAREELLVLAGYDKVKDLQEEYKRLAERRNTLLSQYYNLLDAEKDAEAQPTVKELTRLEARIGYLDSVVDHILSAARYNLVRRRFVYATVVLFAAGTIAAIAIGVFAWAANPPT